MTASGANQTPAPQPSDRLTSVEQLRRDSIGQEIDRNELPAKRHRSHLEVVGAKAPPQQADQASSGDDYEIPHFGSEPAGIRDRHRLHADDP
jgi:hypothetical protein